MKFDEKYLAQLPSLKRLLKVQLEIPCGRFQQSKPQQAHVTSYHFCCTFVNNQAKSNESRLS